MTITRVAAPGGRAWGIAALIAAGIPLPFLFTLNILSLVVRSNPAPAGSTGEGWVYAIIASIGLLLFPLFFFLATVLGIMAVTRPRVAGRVMGWIALGIVLLAIPGLWFGYLVWIG